MDKYDILKEIYGYNSFRGIQEEIIDSILNGNNTIAIMPTGGGKSICFQIPALMLEGITIVVTPLISLMNDQVRELRNNNINAYYINSSLDYDTLNDIYERINDIKILYVSPERLVNKSFLEALDKTKVSLVVIDEAHTIMWHMDFRESFLNIKSFINSFSYYVRLACFTATANKYTIREIKEVIGINNFNVITQSFDREELYYAIYKVKDKMKYIIDYLDNHNSVGIIYAQTRKDVMSIYNALKDKYSVTYYHGGLDNTIKENNQYEFISEKKHIIVCTVSFGMGINKPNIRFVINYNIPDSIESLAQMTGRCSRDKKYGECIILYNDSDSKVLKFFIKNIDSDNKSFKEMKRIKEYKYYQLNSVLYLCKHNVCIHKYMAFYFDEKINNCIKMCNRCKSMKIKKVFIDNID